jgi:uncharacterized tellurite resistance protein B-like protein
MHMLGKAMINSIRAWIIGGRLDGRERGDRSRDELQIALTALLIEAAYSDNHFDQAERAMIAQLIERRFKLSRSEAGALFAAGESEAASSAELFHLTRVINQRLSSAERAELVEMLWEVAYADGVLDEYEDSLLRRVSGLIYVPDLERGMARQRVLERLGLDKAS